MKPRCNLFFLPAKLVAAFALCIASGNAAILTWDANTGTTGAQDGSGTWTSGAGGWWDGSTNVNWAAGDQAIFGTGTDGTYAITIGGPITTGLGNNVTGGLNFANSGYTLSTATAQTISLGNANGTSVIKVSSGKTATIGSNVTVQRAGGSGGQLALLGGGTLEVASGGVLRNTFNNNNEVANGSTLRINGGTVNSQSSLIVGQFTTGWGLGGTVTIDSGALNIATNNIIVGRTAGDVSNFTMNGGTTTITGGHLRTDNGTASIALNGGILTTTQIYRTGGTMNLTLNGGTIKAAATSATDFIASSISSVTVNGNGVTIDSNGRTITANAALQGGTGSGGLTLNDTAVSKGSLTLTGTNTYTGTTTVNAGTLILGASNVIGSGGVTVDGSSAVLSIGGNSDSVGTVALKNGGSITGSSGVLTGTSYAVESGSISAILGGSGVALTKSSSGTVTLSGANTYTGATSINVGRLNVNGSLTSNITVAAGAALGGDGSTTGSLTFGAGNSSLFFDPTSVTTAFTANSISVSGATVLITPTAGTSIGTAYTVLKQTSGSFSGNPNDNFVAASRGTLAYANSGTELTLTPSAAQSITWKGSDGTNPTHWDVVNTVNWDTAGSGDRFYAADTAIFDDTASTYSVAIQGLEVVPAAVNFTNATNAYTISGGAIGGSSTLTKSGAANVSITNANTYTGATTINSGSLTISGSLGATAVTVNGGSLRVTTNATSLGSSTLTLGGGELQLANDTGLVFGRNTTVSGNTQITSDTLSSSAGVTHTLGTLNIGANTLTVAKGSNATGSSARVAFGATTLSGAATFAIGADSTLALGAVANGGNSATITGAGNFVQTGVWGNGSGGITFDSGFSGTATLNQANTYTGVTTISGGTVKAGNAAALGTTAGNTVVNSGGTFDFNGFALAAEAFDLAGGKLTNTGVEQLNAISGALTVSANSQVGGTTRWDVRQPGSSLTVNSGATLTKVDGNVFGVVGRTLVNNGIIQIDAGTFALHTPGSYGGTGTYTVNSGGDLQMGNYGSASTPTLGNSITSNGGTLSSSNSTGTGGAPVWSGQLTLASATTSTFRADADGIISGKITGSGNLKKTGSGTLTLSGADSDYSGSTTVDAGALRVTSAAGLGSSTVIAVNAGRLVLSGGITLGSGATATIKGDGGNFYGSLQANVGTNEWQGNVTIDAVGTRIGVEAGQLTISGVIGSGTNAYGVTLRPNNGAFLVLSGANNYLGDTSIITNGGNVLLSDGDNRLPTGTKLIFGTGTTSGILDLNGRNQQVAGLSVAGGSNNEIKSATAATLTINTAATSPSTWAGKITGAVALTKTGADSLTLTGTNNYTGDTLVSSGVLVVNGSLANTSTTIGNTGTLRGSGSIAGAVTVGSGGTIAAGNSIESLATGALSIEAGGTFAYEIDNDASPTVAGDLTAVTGGLTLDLNNLSLLTIGELGGGSWSIGEKLTLISYSAGGWNGGLFRYSDNTLTDDSNFMLSGMEWRFNYDDTIAGTNYAPTDSTGLRFVTMTAVPEPRAALLGGLGLLALLRRRR